MQIKKTIVCVHLHGPFDSRLRLSGGTRVWGEGEAFCVDVIIWESTNRCGVFKPARA